MARWWGPDGFTVPVCELDVRPGGALRIDMRDPDGVVYPMTGVFLEVVPPERLVFSTAAVPDESGQAQLEGVTTVTLAEQAGQTLLTLRTVIVKAGPGADFALAGMEPGWTQTLDHLTAYVESAQGDSMMSDTADAALPAVPDMKLELVPVPVTDVDRAKAFYVEK